jgi:type IV pilus assembly protein PilB
MKLTDSQLKMLLLGSNLIDYEKFTLAEKEAKTKNVAIIDLLPRLGLVSSEQLGRIIADALKFNFVNLKKEKINTKVLKLIPELVARTRGVIAFDRSTEGIKVGMLDPDDLEMIHLIEKKASEKVIPFFMIREDLEAVMAKFYKGSIEEEFKTVVNNFKNRVLSPDRKDEVIINVVDMLLHYAYDNKASDVHVEPYETKVVIRFRVDGVLHDVLEMPKDLYELVLSRIKILSKMRTDEHRKAQDGKLRFDAEIENVDVRVSIVPTTNGEKTVMRILSSQRTQFGLTDLGLSEYNLKRVIRAINNPHGMILVTGPTGSGKTTTIYGVMKILNRREVNIASIEDPVEYGIEGLNQIQVNEKAGLTFAKGLRALLRQDPDIIMVGEIRDEETAGIAVNSALTGHLVLSTLHTNDAATTLPRLLDMNIEPFLVASTVNIAIAQRLVRQICTKCRVSYKITDEELKIIQKESSIADIIKGEGFADFSKIRFYKGMGCEACGNTGFRGRVAVVEVLEMTEKVRDLVVKRASSDEIQEAAKKDGMTTMLHDGIIKVFKGETTLMELFRVTRE